MGLTTVQRDSETAVKQEWYKGFFSVKDTLIPFLFHCCLGVSIGRCPAPLFAKSSPNSWSDIKVSQDWHVETNVQIRVDG